MTNTIPERVAVSHFAGDMAGVLADVQRGNEVILTRRGVPVARIIPVGPDELEEPMVRESAAVYAPAVVATAPTAFLRLLSTPAMRAIMGVYLSNPAISLHQREIARRAGIGLRSAQLALKRLESAGLLEADRDGNRLYYRVVRGERFEDLRRLMSRELGVAEIIGRHLGFVPGGVELAFVFGSLASGNDTLTSDIDLLVVSDASADQLVRPIADAQREIGREIDLVHYRVSEFERRRQEGNHFISSILAQPRIMIVGEVDDE